VPLSVFSRDLAHVKMQKMTTALSRTRRDLTRRMQVTQDYIHLAPAFTGVDAPAVPEPMVVDIESDSQRVSAALKSSYPSIVIPSVH
jgi:hypothetical protein